MSDKQRPDTFANCGDWATEMPDNTQYVSSAFSNTGRRYLSSRELTIETRVLIPGKSLSDAQEAISEAEKKGLIRKTQKPILGEVYELVRSG